VTPSRLPRVCMHLADMVIERAEREGGEPLTPPENKCQGCASRTTDVSFLYLSHDGLHPASLTKSLNSPACKLRAS
jgi:hypothetical protein